MTHTQKVLQKLDSIDLKLDEAIDLIHGLITTELRKMAICVTDLIVGEPLIRARYLEENEDFHRTIRDYSYNPFPEKVKVGRANYAGQQIFYGARFRVTALGEVRFIYANREKEEARYSHGRWEVREKLKLAAIVNSTSIRKHNAKEMFGLADFIEDLEKEAKRDTDLDIFLGIYRYMAKKYIEEVKEGDEDKYKITAVFSNIIFTKLPDIDGILYQSVQYPKNFNVALKKDVIDQNKIQLSFAARQKYLRTGHLKYKEDESIEAVKIDYNTNQVLW